jgi:hypothetical protein
VRAANKKAYSKSIRRILDRVFAKVEDLWLSGELEGLRVSAGLHFQARRTLIHHPVVIIFSNAVEQDLNRVVGPLGWSQQAEFDRDRSEEPTSMFVVLITGTLEDSVGTAVAETELSSRQATMLKRRVRKAAIVRVGSDVADSKLKYGEERSKVVGDIYIY